MKKIDMKKRIFALVSVAVLIVMGLAAVSPPPVAAAAPGYESHATNVNSSDGATSLTITKPAGTADGDLLIAAVSHNDDNGTISGPSGWIQINQGTSGSSSSADIRLSVWYKVAGGSEPTSYTWTWPSGSYREAVGGIIRYSGVDTTDPIDDSAAAIGDSNSPTAPTVTTTVADTMIFRCWLPMTTTWLVAPIHQGIPVAGILRVPAAVMAAIAEAPLTKPSQE